MSWTAPMTAVAGSVFTAAQFNQSVRDNLLATAPALATTVSGHFAVTGTNSIAQRVSNTATVITAETSTSTSYTSLTTAGPAVTATTGTMALVVVHAGLNNSGAGNNTRMAYNVSGASSVAEADNKGLGVAGTDMVEASAVILEQGLTAGSNTFTATYRVAAGTGTFQLRRIVVFPL